jgi:hypothetical protein
MSELNILAPKATRCSQLRSKSTHAGYGDDFELHEELMGATATYWCLKTMGKAGPDDHYVHKSLCQTGRACHEPSDQQDD